ncbi:MAG: DUF2325 domain-containing protein [Sulfuriferula sp.]|nr:DUF2325 domain-containing protein [Sulfuriferula sp.]
MSDLLSVKKLIPQDVLFISAEDEAVWDTTVEFAAIQKQYAEKLAQASPPLRRKKLWELAVSVHCPVIGTCLNVDELKKLARGAGLHGRDKMSDYALHHAAVSEAKTRNPFSERLQKMLEQKYDLAIKRFAKLKTDTEILQLWREFAARGEAAAGLWATMSHAHISAAAAQLIYENIHMLSHQLGTQTQEEQRLLGTAIDEVAKLRARLQRNSERHAKDLAEKEQVLRLMQTRLTELLAKEVSLQQATARILELESAQERIALIARVAELERQLAMRVQAATLDKSTIPIVPMPAPVTTVSDCAQCDEKQYGRCGGSDLAGRAVLCVGGRAALYPEYRRVVEESGGQFLTHDGGREDSIHRLPALLAKADVVVCPADCLSHGAYYAVKRYCKRYGKPCALLDKSGVSTFRKGVEAVADAPLGAGIVSFV